jgi:hypothetical protein
MDSVTKRTGKNSGEFVGEWLMIRKFKGERGRETYLVRQYLDRKTDKRFTERELVRGPARIGKLKREFPEPEYQYFSDRPGSRANELFAALTWAIFTGDDNCSPGFNENDWRHNLKWARHLLKKNGVRHWRRDQSGLLQIMNAALPPRLKVNGRIKRIRCDWCRFPILFGYRVDGRLVKRRRKLPEGEHRYCPGNGCKMNRWRHPRNQLTSDLMTTA